jgi:glycosyltransferase involved in cell wall biosynthesis
MTPKISIIVPVYNCEKYLKKCIESILSQTYKNIEIILVNDGSLDNCGQICDEYKLKDSRIVVIHQENRGLSGARNSGLEVVTGNYIGFVDSDDWVGKEMYEVMLNVALKYDLNIVECGINETGLETEYNNTELNIVFENSFEALQRIIKNSDFSVCKKLYKKETIKDAKFLLNRTSEDVYFAVENIPKIKKMGYFEFPFYNYRPNPKSITKSPYNIKRFDDSISASLYLEKVLKTLICNNNDRKQGVKEQELLTIVQNFILNELVYHYKMLNYNPNIDPKYVHRKRLKKLINNNYFKSKTHNSYLKLANLLPVYSFEVIINLNKFRHRIFRTNQF